MRKLLLVILLLYLSLLSISYGAVKVYIFSFKFYVLIFLIISGIITLIATVSVLKLMNDSELTQRLDVFKKEKEILLKQNRMLREKNDMLYCMEEFLKTQKNKFACESDISKILNEKQHLVDLIKYHQNVSSILFTHQDKLSRKISTLEEIIDSDDPENYRLSRYKYTLIDYLKDLFYYFF